MINTPPPPKWIADAVLSLVTTAYQAGWADAQSGARTLAVTRLNADESGAAEPKSALRGRAFLTIHELAVYLNVPVWTIRGWRKRKTGDTGPRAMKIGGQWRFNWRDIDEWLSQRDSV